MDHTSRQRRDLDLDDLEDLEEEWRDKWEEFGERHGAVVSTWVWVGLAVLVLVLLVSCVAICCCCLRRRRRGKILRAKPATQVPTISVTHPSTAHITETTTVTHQEQKSPPPPPPSGYPHPPAAGYPAQPAGYYPYPQPAPPYTQAGPHGMPPPYDAYHQQPAYNPGFQPGPTDVVTPM